MAIRRDQLRPAFTMIELIVVVVMLGVLAGAIIPRMMRRSDREAEQNVRVLADLFSTAAARAAIAGQHVALWFDAAGDAKVWMETSRAANSADFETNPQWSPDPIVPEQPADRLTFVSGSVDGRLLDARKWTIEMVPGQERGMVVASFRDREGSRTWTIVLPPGSLRAQVIEGATPFDESVDLDLTGMGEVSW
ncbi:MAG: type II secretion system protein [Phycisphaerae bacterium]|nr:type II secretion system protein [Phycisphaerae bacterium]